MSEPSQKPAEKKKVWVRIYDNEETEKRLQAMDVDEQIRDAIRQFKRIWNTIRYSDAVEVPPAGEYFFPQEEKESASGEPPPVEQIEERVVVTRGEPKVTRTRRRVVAIRPRSGSPG